MPNLMIGFGIDEVQAEFVAEIRLRNINRQYILKRVEETTSLEAEIASLEELVGSKTKLRNVIIKELGDIAKKYGAPRRTVIIEENEKESFVETDETPDYPVNLFLSREGYFKKITPQSLRMSGEQKLKEGDAVAQTFEARNEMCIRDRYGTARRLRSCGVESALFDCLPLPRSVPDGRAFGRVCDSPSLQNAGAVGPHDVFDTAAQSFSGLPASGRRLVWGLYD